MRWPALCMLLVASITTPSHLMGSFGNPIVKQLRYPSEQLLKSAQAACEQKEWQRALLLLQELIEVGGDTPQRAEAHFLAAVCNFELGELLDANEALSHYLAERKESCHFIEAIRYKLAIAERFRKGEKLRLWGLKSMPKWVSGYDLAIDLYDEVIMAMPSHELAASALYAKAQLLTAGERWQEAADTYQFLLRRFPHHPLQPSCYAGLVHLFLSQAQREGVSPELLASAELAIEKFANRFPGDERLPRLEADLEALKECHGRFFWQMGSFYEKLNYPIAALLYYKSCAERYPESRAGLCCIQRISQLEKRWGRCLVFDKKGAPSLVREKPLSKQPIEEGSSTSEPMAEVAPATFSVS